MGLPGLHPPAPPPTLWLQAHAKPQQPSPSHWPHSHQEMAHLASLRPKPSIISPPRTLQTSPVPGTFLQDGSHQAIQHY